MSYVYTVFWLMIESHFKLSAFQTYLAYYAYIIFTIIVLPHLFSQSSWQVNQPVGVVLASLNPMAMRVKYVDALCWALVSSWTDSLMGF